MIAKETEMSVSEWADNYRMLSSGISAEPGRYKTSRATYQREVMDSFTQPGIWKAVAKFCSQSGKSDKIIVELIQEYRV